MKVSLDWLASFVDLPPQAELEERLTLAGLEIEEVLRTGPDLSAIRVGHVLERRPHPNAERLAVCSVDLGLPAPATISTRGWIIVFAAPPAMMMTWTGVSRTAPLRITISAPSSRNAVLSAANGWASMGCSPSALHSGAPWAMAAARLPP